METVTHPDAPPQHRLGCPAATTQHYRCDRDCPVNIARHRRRRDVIEQLRTLARRRGSEDATVEALCRLLPYDDDFVAERRDILDKPYETTARLLDLAISDHKLRRIAERVKLRLSAGEIVSETFRLADTLRPLFRNFLDIFRQHVTAQRQHNQGVHVPQASAAGVR
jgi:hypothetical protein